MSVAMSLCSNSWDVPLQDEEFWCPVQGVIM